KNRRLPAASTDDEWVTTRRGGRNLAERHAEWVLNEGAGEPCGIVDHRLDRLGQAGESIGVYDQLHARAVAAVQGHRGVECGCRHDRADREPDGQGKCEDDASHLSPPCALLARGVASNAVERAPACALQETFHLMRSDQILNAHPHQCPGSMRLSGVTPRTAGTSS